MRLLARVGLLLLAVVFIAIFLFGAFRFFHELGISPLRYLLEDLLVAVAGALGFAACLMKSRKLEQQQRAELDAVVFTASRFEANMRKWPMLLWGALLLMGLAALGLSLAKNPFDAAGTLLTSSFVLLMLALMPIMLAQYRSGKSSLVMDGFALDHVLYGPIRWDQIQGAHLGEIVLRGRKIHRLHLLVTKPGRYLTNAPWLQRLFLTQKRREAPFGEIVLPIQNLDQPPTLVLKALLALRSRVSPPLLAGWVPGLSLEAIKLHQESLGSIDQMEAITRALEAGAVTPEQASREMEAVAADMGRQSRQRAPLVVESMAKIKRAKRINAAVMVGVVLYILARLFSLKH